MSVLRDEAGQELASWPDTASGRNLATRRLVSGALSGLPRLETLARVWDALPGLQISSKEESEMSTKNEVCELAKGIALERCGGEGYVPLLTCDEDCGHKRGVYKPTSLVQPEGLFANIPPKPAWKLVVLLARTKNDREGMPLRTNMLVTAFLNGAVRHHQETICEIMQAFQAETG